MKANVVKRTRKSLDIEIAKVFFEASIADSFTGASGVFLSALRNKQNSTVDVIPAPNMVNTKFLLVS